MGSSDSPVTGFKSANLFTKPEPTRTKFEGDEGFFCSLSAMAAIFLPKQDCENILSNTYLIKSHIICIKFLCITYLQNQLKRDRVVRRAEGATHPRNSDNREPDWDGGEWWEAALAALGSGGNVGGNGGKYTTMLYISPSKES